ncbi:hypothetical protein GOP47_0023534 [Adiantum capillus-veneris]|uniref:2,4-dienoyl-CoA reductase [(3E)-enoyl-CoA-producing] n=1 Tax=Adiantum capillus-veneris TaxID=13818 RepID=A0A9D4Z4J7_ADICA|nr:hypothetical protein GOP47_0023534 [Adiantum capillus-veneris]
MEDGEEQKSPFREGILRGQVALVTGGGSGIGFEVARQLGLHGSSLVLMGRRLWVLQRAAQTLRELHVQVEVVQGEVRSSDDANKAVKVALSSFGRLDILVNSAAGNFLAPAEVLAPKGFRTVIEIDTIGTFNMCHASFSALRKDGEGKDSKKGQGGVIINISATLHYGATWYQAHASAAKAAIDSLTRSLCLEWGPEYGIRVNGIAPGPVDNTAGALKLGVSNTAERPDLAAKIPIGRLGTTWDIAMAAVFLASNAGSWISGETLVVDGGHWLYKPASISRKDVVMASRSVEQKSRDTGIPDSAKSKL